MARLFTALLFCLFLGSCLTDESADIIIIDIETFEDITEEYPYSDVLPSGQDSYWQLNRTFGEEAETLFTNGTLCAGTFQDSATCVSEFQDLDIPLTGFAISCLPAGCYHYIKTNNVNFNRILNTPNEVSSFLGGISSPGEALLLSFVNGYYFSVDDKAAGAIKEVDNGYELLVLALVSDCQPVQINRSHLRVNQNSTIKFLGVEIISEDEDASI